MKPRCSSSAGTRNSTERKTKLKRHRLPKKTRKHDCAWWANKTSTAQDHSNYNWDYCCFCETRNDVKLWDYGLISSISKSRAVLSILKYEQNNIKTIWQRIYEPLLKSSGPQGYKMLLTRISSCSDLCCDFFDVVGKQNVARLREKPFKQRSNHLTHASSLLS